MKKMLSMLLIVTLVMLSGCAKNDVVTITASGRTFEITSEYTVLSAGSGFIVTLEDGNAVAMLLSNDDSSSLKETCIEQDILSEDAEQYFIYEERYDDSTTYTYVSKFNEEYSYLISYNDLSVLKQVVENLTVREVVE